MGLGRLGYRNLVTRVFPHHTQTPHLDSGAPGETEVFITMLCLPGIGAPGVADDDRLTEAGIEVKS